MKLAYFDCFSGISGDMTLGALVDAGCDLRTSARRTRKAECFRLATLREKVWKNGMAATYVKVKAEDQQKHRSLSAILEILSDSQLVAAVRERAAAIFQKLGEAEAAVHDVPLEKIHFHEVGAIDAIVDIVGACIGFAALGIDKFACSPLNVGGGTAKMAHGVLPVPAPATANLLEREADLLERCPARIGYTDRCRHRRDALRFFGPQPPMTVDVHRLRRGHRRSRRPAQRAPHHDRRSGREGGSWLRRRNRRDRSQSRRHEPADLRLCSGKGAGRRRAGCLHHAGANEKESPRHAAHDSVQAVRIRTR